MGTYVSRSVVQVNEAMTRVYGHMSLAIVNSMLVSGWVASSPEMLQFLFTGIMRWVIIFSPLILYWFAQKIISKLSRPAAIGFLHAFAALMGASFSYIFILYEMSSIVSAFMGTAVLFTIMASYGYYTKKDLSGWGPMLAIGLIAILASSLINLFFATLFPGMIDNALLGSAISAVAIVIFLALTAYETQHIREAVRVDSSGKAEILGAVILYTTFISLFLSLLRLFGVRSDD